MRDLTVGELVALKGHVKRDALRASRVKTGCWWLLPRAQGGTFQRWVFLRPKRPSMPLLAHECKHVELFQRYGTWAYAGAWVGSFLGLLLEDLVRGIPFRFWRYAGRANAMERECYQAADSIR